MFTARFDGHDVTFTFTEIDDDSTDIMYRVHTNYNDFNYDVDFDFSFMPKSRPEHLEQFFRMCEDDIKIEHGNGEITINVGETFIADSFNIVLKREEMSEIALLRREIALLRRENASMKDRITGIDAQLADTEENFIMRRYRDQAHHWARQCAKTFPLTCDELLQFLSRVPQWFDEMVAIERQILRELMESKIDYVDETYKQFDGIIRSITIAAHKPRNTNLNQVNVSIKWGVSRAKFRDLSHAQFMRMLMVAANFAPLIIGTSFDSNTMSSTVSLGQWFPQADVDRFSAEVGRLAKRNQWDITRTGADNAYFSKCDIKYEHHS